jgi:hypothetical protein
MEAKDLTFEDIKVEDSASFERVFTEEDVKNFAELSGDKNPLHTDESYAETTQFKHKLVHGMLVGSLLPNGRSEKVPNPSHNRIPTSIHNHPSRPNVHWYCKDENQDRHPAPRHSHNSDNLSIGHRGLVHHKRSGKKHRCGCYNSAPMFCFAMNCPARLPAPVQQLLRCVS